MPIPLRADFDAQKTTGVAMRFSYGPQARRLLALSAIYDGARRKDAARIRGMTPQIVRNWVFNTRGPDGPVDRKQTGHFGRTR
jgi:hypothetical protein